MSKRPRRNHAPAFKVKVALEALKEEQTLVELSQRYQGVRNPFFLDSDSSLDWTVNPTGTGQ